jgi:hypothetical protein
MKRDLAALTKVPETGNGATHRKNRNNRKKRMPGSTIQSSSSFIELLTGH